MNAARVVSLRDIVNATVFAALAPAAWLLPESSWPRLSEACAKVHIRLRGSAAGRLAGHPAVAASQLSSAGLERTLLAGRYEEILQTLREHRPGGWNGTIELVGREHLDDAIGRGRGAVLWVAPCNFAELNVKKALHARGYRLTNLRSHIHPYSGTRIGRAVLNRVRTSVEDRYLAHTVTLGGANGAAALRELQSRLRANDVVSITANSAGERPARLPFLDGTLTLALGAPTLARLAKAPLLPVFALPARSGVYGVRIEQALSVEGDVGGRRHDETMAAEFARRLEAFVKRNLSSTTQSARM